MKRFKRHIREGECNCPEGWSVFFAFENWCMCIEDHPVGIDLGDSERHLGRTLGEGKDGRIIHAQDLPRPIQFPLLENDDTVRVKLSQDGMFIRVGTSGFFPVPEREQEHVWRLIEDRLHA